MTAVPAWFERKFEFTFPSEQFPNLCIRLRGTPGRLEEILTNKAIGRLQSKPEGKWSAQEHAGHLADMEPLWDARVHDFLADGQTLTVADLSNRKTHEANHNGRALSEILTEFRGARMTLCDRLNLLPAESYTRALIHPRLQQPMRLVDHLYFVAEHDDHHLAQIWELVAAS